MKPVSQQSQLSDLWSTVERFARMQEDHLAAMRRGKLRDLAYWQGERERAFAGVSRALDALGDLDRLADQDLAGRLREQIGNLLAMENRLRKEMRDCREGVRDQLVAIRKGRNVVRRIGTQPESAPRPRFVSNMA